MGPELDPVVTKAFSDLGNLLKRPARTTKCGERELDHENPLG
jgi:hypothetical protein